jgi:hypothetical protein
MINIDSLCFSPGLAIFIICCVSIFEVYSIVLISCVIKRLLKQEKYCPGDSVTYKRKYITAPSCFSLAVMQSVLFVYYAESISFVLIGVPFCLAHLFVWFLTLVDDKFGSLCVDSDVIIFRSISSLFKSVVVPLSCISAYNLYLGGGLSVLRVVLVDGKSMFIFGAEDSFFDVVRCNK